MDRDEQIKFMALRYAWKNLHWDCSVEDILHFAAGAEKILRESEFCSARRQMEHVLQ